MAIEYSKDPDHLPDQGLLPIRTVSSLTGVNPVTLRAWERRYGLIKPVRTPKGHRLYTLDDVALIKRVVALLEAGMSVGQAGQALTADASKAKANLVEEQLDAWADYQRRLLRAITLFDENTLNDLYNEALSLYPVDIVTSRLIVPLLEELGRRWETSQGSVAEEHFFSLFLRNKLGARFHHRSREPRGPKLLAACLPGERHEVGILLFALAAVDWNYRTVLLGPCMPLEELPSVVERAHCHAIVLSGCVPAAEETVRRMLPHLVQQAKVPVFVGGKVTLHQAGELAAAGAISLGEELNLALRKIDSVLGH